MMERLELGTRKADFLSNILKIFKEQNKAKLDENDIGLIDELISEAECLANPYKGIAKYYLDDVEDRGSIVDWETEEWVDVDLNKFREHRDELIDGLSIDITSDEEIDQKILCLMSEMLIYEEITEEHE